MTLRGIVQKLDLIPLGGTGEQNLDKKVTGCYASDLLSDVMANSKEGNIWITLQIHANVIAVATLNDLTGIIFVNGRKPEQETLEKARDKNIPLFMSKLQTYELAGKMYQLGII
ncbi:serine kinase [bacterium SM23_31]|nr:MAG: serine kinase [bacterium SM23_31]